ncbi:long-chain-fatty-acid--CoA ligase [Salinithrix halophila]|uniref:Long-chain-fatty-acid--CoA ligase n=1 Tax=Salinithrix halophila TaxID=1485204 RepID=A0ABV8JGU7_9BACL
MILTKGLLVSAQNRADCTAVIDGERRFTYGQFHDRTSQLKGALKDRGIQKGDRVALLMMNNFRYLELFYAVTSIGAIVVPLNVRLTLPELERILEDAQPVMLFLSREFLPAAPILKSKVPSIRRLVLAEDRKPGRDEGETISYEDLIQSQAPSPLDYEGVEEGDPAGLFYTGGTTGRPKGVILTHRNLVANAWHVALGIGYDRETRYLHAGPMFHLADGASTFAVTLVGGSHSHLRVFRPAEFLQVLERERPNATLLVPTMIHALLQSPELAKRDTASLGKIVYGGSPMPVEVMKKALDRLPGVRFYQAYGMSEAAPVLTVLQPEDHDGLETEREHLLTSCGQPVAGVEIKLVDSEGDEVLVGEVGEVIARGPNIMQGYWNLPEETALALRDGWYYTGDMAYRDKENYYYIVDRKKDMIVSGGENVYSVEVENTLYRHPDVVEAAVVGVPDKSWGERVLAMVVKREGSALTEETLIEHCRESLAGFKVPKCVEFTEELPKSGAGKILKRSLREKYWESHTRRVN